MTWQDARLASPGEEFVDDIGNWYARVVQSSDDRWHCRVAWNYQEHPTFATMNEAKAYCQMTLDEYWGAGLDTCGLHLSR